MNSIEKIQKREQIKYVNMQENDKMTTLLYSIYYHHYVYKIIFLFKAVECPVLKTTIANGKVTSCGKFYKETCTFTCNENFHIVNEVATSKKLDCLINGHWSQGLPSCVCKNFFVL